GYRFQYDPVCSLYHLGPSVVPKGGARSQHREGAFWYFHHCVGDWYFNLKYCNRRNVTALFDFSLRHFVLNRQTMARPWRLPIALVYWMAGFPVAAWKRLKGSRL